MRRAAMRRTAIPTSQTRRISLHLRPSDGETLTGVGERRVDERF
jgi:hypothetical protein